MSNTFAVLWPMKCMDMITKIFYCPACKKYLDNISVGISVLYSYRISFFLSCQMSICQNVTWTMTAFSSNIQTWFELLKTYRNNQDEVLYLKLPLSYILINIWTVKVGLDMKKIYFIVKLAPRPEHNLKPAYASTLLFWI